MTIGIPESAWSEKPNIGDKILVYDSNDMLVGQSHYRELGTVITVWGDDLTTDIIDGLSVGEKLQFKLWDFQTNTTSELLVTKWDARHKNKRWWSCRKKQPLFYSCISRFN